MAKKQSRKNAARGAAKGTRGRRTGPAAKRAGAGRTTTTKTAAKKKTPARKIARSAAPAGRAEKTAARGGGRSTGRTTGGRRTGGGQLSRSTQNATWIESPEDRSERAGQTLATRSHEVIQRWAEERGAEPSTIPGGDPESPRVLRFNFPGFGGENLQPISWDDWFRTFDDRDLVFVFQDRLKSGNQSNFFRFDSPDREDA